MQNNTLAQFPKLELQLLRYPKYRHDKSLQAWDSADLLVAEYLAEKSTSDLQVLLFNDGFGALANYFCARKAKVTSVSDSLISQLATQQNLLQNKLDNSVQLLSSTEDLQLTPDIVVIKIPKTLALLEYQLAALSQVVTKETTIIGAAKVKDIHNSTLSLFERYMGDTKTSLAKKKSRLIFSQSQRIPASLPAPTQWEAILSDQHCQLKNLANVFSREKMDIGGRFLLEHLPQLSAGMSIIDLGCGNGMIGLACAIQQPDIQLTFVDESYMAVDSAKLNVELNRPELLERCQFKVNNCLQHFPSNSADLVLCNPPFHQQNTVTEHIAMQMFKDAHKVLKLGAELRVVANRHLAYYGPLKKLFSTVERSASNSKFVVLSCQK